MTMKTTVAKPDSRGPAATAQTALTEKNGSPSQPSEREYYCLQRFDRCDLTPEKLLFAASIKAGRMAVGDPVLLGNGDWIGGGTVRNSLYLEPLRYISDIRQISLTVEAQGLLEIQVMCAGTECGCSTVSSFVFDSRASVARHAFPIGAISSFPKDSRLFWHIESCSDNSALLDVSFATTTPPNTPDLRMAVLLRTFGRTKDLKSVLETFWRQAGEDALYQRLLDHLDFWVLDTSSGADADYRDPWLKNFNLQVYTGPNLGGGGNASVLIDIFHKSTEAAPSSRAIDEVVILDDDLHLSLESLYRYYRLCTHRAKECIVSLPVMEKSNPAKVWEDGAWWGRQHPSHSAIGTQRAIEPTLLKHGHHLDQPAEADVFCRLNICEYSTFIFLGISKKLLEQLGYPAAFFLRGDDIEFCLRANAAGIEVITIPSLAAWHEPGHSYAQEYMAILHGVIINMVYSTNRAQDYFAFFHQRYAEHAALGDLPGLELYCSVLRELNNADSLVLSQAFDSHYKKAIKSFASQDWHKVPKSQQPTYEEKLRRNGREVVPFLYPGLRPHLPASQPKPFLKCYPADTYKELPSPTVREQSRTAVAYFGQLDYFVTNFDAVAARWKERVRASSTPAFWDEVVKSHSAEIKRFVEHSRSSSESAKETHSNGAVPALPVAGQIGSSETAGARKQCPALLTLDGEQFVKEAYRAVLQRDADSRGLATYVTQLERGISKLRILQSLAESPEGRGKGANLPAGNRTILKNPMTRLMSCFSRKV
jgi:hypothetical protein